MLEKAPCVNKHFNRLKNNSTKGLRPSLLAFAIAQTLALSTGVQAATIVVNTALDASVTDADCSLREAVSSMLLGDVAVTGCVNSGAAFATDDQINFSVASVNVTEGQLNISKSLTINGGNTGVSISGDGTSRLLRLEELTNPNPVIILNNLVLSGGGNAFGGGAIGADDVTVELNNSTVTGNSALFGGGINIGAGSLTINNSTVSGNTAAIDGGGISTTGVTNLNNSTVSNNIAQDGAGGISVGYSPYSSGTLNLNNSTVSNNAPEGIYVDFNGTATLNNSIVANSGTVDCSYYSGSITANNKNIIEDGSCGTDALSVDPLLGPLADNGGPTETHALLDGSPAINAGDNAICAAPPINNLDQRGVVRPIGAICDIGAVEFEATPEENSSFFFVIPLPNGKVISFDL